MTTRDDNGPAAFFGAMTRAFETTIATHRGRADFVGALCAQAFDSFEGNLAVQAEGAPAIACQGDCPACCVLRVVATAPEIFLIARFVAANAERLAGHGVDLRRRIAETDDLVGGRSESERIALRRSCPFVEGGLCLAYRLRPLACRGHASYNKNACLAATDGENVDATVSTPHLMVRSLVQNAMMSALREARLSWRLYELNGGLSIALSRREAEARWIAGDDPLLPAAVAEFDAREAAAAFDALRAG